MFGFGKRLVYRSKDEADWKKAQNILTDAGIEMKAWTSQEPPVGGCGCKLDLRSFGPRGANIPKEIYKIEVDKNQEANAATLLEGNVLPIRAYGPGI